MKSVLVIGMGTVGQHLAMKMQELGNDVMVVDKDENTIQELAVHFPNAIVGDCANEAVIKSIGVRNFDICFVAIGENFFSSLEITAILKEQGAVRVVSKAKQQRQADFLKKIGADEVFYPEKEIAEKLAVRYNATNIYDFIELTSDCSIFEIPIVPEWAGRTILDINVRNKYNVNIIAVKNADNKTDPMPSSMYQFKPEDHIVVIGNSSDVFKLAAKTK